MAYVKRITKIEKIEKGEVKVCRLLSDPTLFFKEDGNVISGFKRAEDLYAIVTPSFCKQLQMMTRFCHYDHYLHMIEDAKIFCSDIYHSIMADGLYHTMDKKRGVQLYTDDSTIIYTLEKGYPQRVNEPYTDWICLRRLTLNKESKMSKKLWSVTDWLLRK